MSLLCLCQGEKIAVIPNRGLFFPSEFSGNKETALFAPHYGDMALFDKGQALLIGIADYKHIPSLPDVVIHDVHGIYQLLIDSLRCGYPIPNVQALLDAQATKSAILAAFDSLAARCDPDSTAFIYFSGHGGSVASGAEAGQYLLPVDVEVDASGLVTSTAISHDEFTTCLDKIPARRVVVFFDCCHAGGIGTVKSSVGFDLKNLPDDYYEILSEGQGRAIFASSLANETSLILNGANNSLFTEVLLQGLRGEAANRNKGIVRVVDLYSYISNKIGDLNVKQHPFFRCSAENFPLALYQGDMSSSALPVQAPREAETTLKIQTPTGLSDRMTVEVARIEGLPSIESRVEAERDELFPTSYGLSSPMSMLLNMNSSSRDSGYYFEESFPKFLKKNDNYLNTKNRIAQITFVLMNEGNLPGTDVQLIVDFSNVGQCLRRADIPSRPIPPKRPDLLSSGLLTDYSFVLPPRPLNFPPALKRETEPFAFGTTSIEWRIRHLQHQRSIVFEPVFLLVTVPGDFSATVEVPFEIHATQFLEARKGEVMCDINVRAIHWLQAEQDDRDEQLAQERERDDDEDED